MSSVAESMLWGGRFTEGLDPLMQKYNESLPYDRIFWRQDIAGSLAWARANVATGILTEAEFNKIEQGFARIAEEWQTNSFEVQKDDEDIHTANERRLSEVVGKEVGGKLHTGRSRNDQIATDMRLWLRDELKDLEKCVVELLEVMMARAKGEIDHIIPGYTHLQKAQPVRFSHWLLSHAAAISDDLTRLREVIARTNRSPLGCGALAGNPFGVDRAAIAAELGFDGVLPNSMAAVGDRYFVLETVQWGAMLMLKISRLAEDLIIYSSLEFGFVRLSDAYSTGSSLMPQKKNPDSMELVRGKAGRVQGHVVALSCAIKGLPTTYNKDLQESVEPLLDHVKTVGDSLRITARVIATMKVQPTRMKAALAPEMLATEFADYLVRKGVPFREAHHVAGRIVQKAEESGGEMGATYMDRLSVEELQSVDSRLEDDCRECLDYERAVELKSAAGGTSRSAVLEQVERLREVIQG